MNFTKHWAGALDDYVIDLAWSPAGHLLAAASAGGGITLFDAATGAVARQLRGHEDGANCIAWMPEIAGGALCPDASRDKPAPAILASSGQDGFVRCWDSSSGAQTAEVKIGSGWVEHIAWAPDNSALPAPRSQLLMAAAGRRLVALKPDGTVAHQFPDAPKTISALAWRPDGGAFASACFGHVTIWDATTFAALKEYPYANAILALTWSPDGRWLVAGCHDNAVHLWVPAEELELQMSGYETKLKELSFSSDSRWLATGGGRDACVWDCSGAGPEGREPLLLPQAARTTAVAFQRAHGLLATGDAGGVFTLWSPTRKNPMVAEVRMPAPATKFAWRPDDSLLAVGTEQGAVFVFKTA
ncbi:MAG TPA: WD40 repeat domain-containing protein [Lacunisphaera sp.]|nr:WD40 repeat domain-containing protein [Lacunisphaera sp.]